jgi:inosose dehydratase
MRLATAPVNWNNPDVPEYRAWIPYGRMMDEFVAAGYGACEWG